MGPGRSAAHEHGWPFDELDSGEGDRHFVRELLPEGYARYVRVLDPWHPAQGDAPRLRWRQLAEQAGVEWYSEITWQELEDATRQPRSPVDLFAGSDAVTRKRVVDHLVGVSGGPFLFAFELWAAVSLSESPVIIELPSLDLAAAREKAAGRSRQPHPILGDPEHWWPRDRTWVVSCDYDLDELYVAANDDLAPRLLDDPELEVVEVTLGSRVDWHVDDDRRHRA